MATRTENELLGSLARAQIGLKAPELQMLLDVIKRANKHNAWSQVREFSKSIAETVASDMFSTTEYFATRDGLYVSPEFRKQILPAYQSPIKKRGLKDVAYVNIPRNMYDVEIIGEYLDGLDETLKHAFTPDQIAEFINTQPNGIEGQLLNNGSPNIFYVVGKNEEIFAVRVHWHLDKHNWHVTAYSLEESGGWYAGARFFRNKH